MKRLRIFLAQVGSTNPVTEHLSPPLGLLYLAGYLRSKFEVDLQLVNQRLENCSDDSLVRQAAAFQADVVGFGALTPDAYHLPYLTQQVRAALPETLVLLGGAHASAFGARALENTAAHVVVPGEGELACEAVLRAHFEGGRLAEVPGISWRDSDGEVVTNPGRFPYIEDLDALPMPAYDLIDLPAYWKRMSFAHVPRRQYVSLFSSRGCPYNCCYCHDVFGKRFRRHSPERMLAEMQYCQKQYGVHDFDFLDDIFNLDHKRVMAFCGLVQRHGLRAKIAFPNGIRGDILTDEELDALAASGMYYASFALESGSPRLQEFMGKRLNIPRLMENIEGAVRRGVFCNGYAMFGFPTETAADMELTLNHMCQSPLHTASFFTVTPFPGTRLYEMASKTHAEQLARLRYDDLEYFNVTVNLSDEPDEVLFAYERRANRRFYLNPARIARILWDHPQPYLLPLYLPIFVRRVTKGLLRGSKKTL